MVNFPQALWATRTPDVHDGDPGANVDGSGGGVTGTSSSQYIDSLHSIVEKYHRQIPDFTVIQMREILFKDPQGMLNLLYQRSRKLSQSHDRNYAG